MMQVGDKIPDFTAIDSEGKPFESSSVIGAKPVVLYFYPKNFTPGCTKEACQFRDQYEAFKELGAEVIAVSSDSPKSHQKFKSAYQLPFIFIADEQKELRRKFGIKNNAFGLLPGRETFVIDKNGILQMRFNSINATRHMPKALQKLKYLSKHE